MMRRAFAAIACFGALAALAAQAYPAVAFVADVQGNATIEGDGPLHFLAELAPGTRLLVATNARVVVTYVGTGAEFTARGPGEFSVRGGELRADVGAPPSRQQVSAVTSIAPVSATSRMATASVRMRGLKGREAAEVTEAPLSAEARAKISRSQAAAKTFSARVSHALLLQELGAVHEAREAWAQLARERPDLQELAALQP